MTTLDSEVSKKVCHYTWTLPKVNTCGWSTTTGATCTRTFGEQHLNDTFCTHQSLIYELDWPIHHQIAQWTTQHGMVDLQDGNRRGIDRCCDEALPSYRLDGCHSWRCRLAFSDSYLAGLLFCTLQSVHRSCSSSV